MPKLMGTGKDPRMPKGQDYDVFDAEVDIHVENGLGKLIPAGKENATVFKSSYDLIDTDPAEEANQHLAEDGNDAHGNAGRTASRVDTALKGNADKQAKANDDAAKAEADKAAKK
jgi:hypothetical protein